MGIYVSETPGKTYMFQHAFEPWEAKLNKRVGLLSSVVWISNLQSGPSLVMTLWWLT